MHIENKPVPSQLKRQYLQVFKIKHEKYLIIWYEVVIIPQVVTGFDKNMLKMCIKCQQAL